MSDKMFAIVGNWGFVPGESKGISVFEYAPDTAEMKYINTVFDDVYAGQQYIDEERNIIYFVNEIESRRNEVGGGGYVMALKIDPQTGELALINEKESLSPKPTYVIIDKTKRYALVSHHAARGHVTKIRKDGDGSYASDAFFDDTALVLFRINEDGSLGDACDVSITKGRHDAGSNKLSHQHAVVPDPTGELFIVCDKGMDKIYSYSLDRGNGRIVKMSQTSVEHGSAPRYAAFHPKLPIFYVNNEHKTLVYTFKYDVKTGKMEQIDTTSLLTDEKLLENAERVEPSDIVVSDDGNNLYVSIRGLELISMLAIDGKGKLTLKQNVNSGGINPRGLCLSPDSRYLFAANMLSGNISKFSIQSQGFLSPLNKDTQCLSPANMKIFSPGQKL